MWQKFCFCIYNTFYFTHFTPKKQDSHMCARTHTTQTHSQAQLNERGMLSTVGGPRAILWMCILSWCLCVERETDNDCAWAAVAVCSDESEAPSVTPFKVV